MIEAVNIHKVYSTGKKELRVLKGIDIKIDKGRFVAVVGPSGAGKSTLMHILGGLDHPSQGRVLLDKEDIYSLKDSEISQIRNIKVGFVFQFYHLMPEFTVLENVLMPVIISGEKLKTQERALGLLEEVGLKDRITHFPNQLSGGEKQRVAMARALVNNPALLLCDEPTGNLDSQAGDDIMILIRKISRKNNMTVVLITHNKELTKEADRIFHLKDGVLVD